VLGKGPPGRALAGEGGDRGGLGRSHLGGQLILRRRRLELFQLQLQLIEQTGGPLGPRTVPIPVKLLDLELEMDDQRLMIRQLSPRGGGLGAGDRELRLDGVGLGSGENERRLERFDIVRHGLHGGVHGPDGITKPAPCGAPKCSSG
jgi:hypothetical protein